MRLKSNPTRLQRWRWTAKVVIAAGIATLTLGAVGFVALNLSSLPATSIPLRSPDAGQGSLKIVALGDSFMSGEGASAFYAGTDVPGVNSCRRAPTAYPVLLAQQLPERLRTVGHDYSNVTLVFVACSGAETVNIGSQFNFKELGSTYDIESVSGVSLVSNEGVQIDALRENTDADVVLISVGGNDARFSDVVTTCTGHSQSCIPLAQKWLQHLDDHVQPRLRALFQEVRAIAPDALIYAVRYPNPFGAAECRSLGVDAAEVRFLRERFLPRLNEQIHLAAIMMGVREIDLFDVFGAQGLCGTASPAAMNGFHWQQTSKPLSMPLDLLRGSMHPTAAGHALMARAIAERIVSDIVHPEPPDGWMQGYIPGAPMGCPPDLPECKQPPTLPPFEVTLADIGVPVGPWDMQSNPNPCTGLATQRNITVGNGRRTVLEHVLPHSQVCLQTYAAEWQITTADAEGTVTVDFGTRQPAGVSGLRHVLYQRRDGEWVWHTESPPAGAKLSTLEPFEAWLGFSRWWLLTAFPLIVIVIWRIEAFRERRMSGSS
jgi:lysophospholipase L1-like esterase